MKGLKYPLSCLGLENIHLRSVYPDKIMCENARGEKANTTLENFHTWNKSAKMHFRVLLIPVSNTKVWASVEFIIIGSPDII